MPRRILHGTVVSDKNHKTVVVEVERRYRHPVYKKFVVRSKRYAAHDENDQAKVGDRVRIRECRPISKTKCWEILIDAPENAQAAASEGMASEGTAGEGMASS